MAGDKAIAITNKRKKRIGTVPCRAGKRRRKRTEKEKKKKEKKKKGGGEEGEENEESLKTTTSQKEKHDLWHRAYKTLLKWVLRGIQTQLSNSPKSF